MTGPLNFSTRRADPARIAAIKRWVVDAFELPEDVAVMVTELRCAEPGCPPLETVIALLRAGDSTRQHTIHRPMADVTEQEIRALASGTPEQGADGS